MDAIRLYSAQVPDRVKKVVRTLVQGSDEDVRDFLPIELGKIERNSAECLRLAQAVEAKFEHVMNLTGELMEVSSEARGYYEKAQEETQLKRDIALTKEKEARERVELAKKQQERIEKDVREAKRSWEKAVDSMPGGWDVLGMEVVETIVHCAFDKSRPGADRRKKTDAEQSPAEDQPVSVAGGVGEQLKIYTTRLSEDLTSASEKGKSESESKEEPLDKKLLKMKVAIHSLQDGLAGEDTDSEVHELLKEGLEISREGENMASQLSFTPSKLMGIAKRAAKLKDNVTKFCAKRRAKTEGNPYTTKPPRQAKSMASCASSARPSAARSAIEGAQIKMAETKSLLERQEDRYDTTCEQLRESNQELSKVLESLAEFSLEKLADFDQIRNTLMQGIKALASVREQWTKLVEFFQYVTILSRYVKMKASQALLSTPKWAKSELWKTAMLVRISCVTLSMSK